MFLEIFELSCPSLGFNPQLALIYSALILLAYSIVWRAKPAKNYPPGPSTLGLLANCLPPFNTRPFLRLDHENLLNYIKSFGKVTALQIGPQKVLVINDVKVMREALNNPMVSARPNADILRHDHRQLKGMVTRNGAEWKEIRGFTVKILKTYGMNKSILGPILAQEAESLVKRLTSVAQTGAPLRTEKFFDISVYNVMWTVVTGERNPDGDPNTRKLLDFFGTFNSAIQHLSALYMYPWLAKIFWALPTKLKRSQQFAVQFFDNYVTERRISYEKTRIENAGEIKDFTTAFLEKVQTTTEMKETSSIFYGENGYEELAAVLRDFQIGGLETTYGALSWLCLMLALYPDKQKKLQDQIDRVLQGRSVTLSDKTQNFEVADLFQGFRCLIKRLPYVEAVISETLRKPSMAYIGVPHRTSEPTKIAGYDIPKDVVVIPSIYSTHQDPKIWGDPENFRPERFIDQDNNLIHHEALIPFGVGKRMCPGESLARNELFCFTASIFGRFSVKLNPNEPRPTTQGKPGMLLQPRPHTLIIEPRVVQGA